MTTQSSILSIAATGTVMAWMALTPTWHSVQHVIAALHFELPGALSNGIEWNWTTPANKEVLMIDMGHAACEGSVLCAQGPFK